MLVCCLCWYENWWSKITSQSKRSKNDYIITKGQSILLWCYAVIEAQWLLQSPPPRFYSGNPPPTAAMLDQMDLARKLLLADYSILAPGKNGNSCCDLHQLFATEVERRPGLFSPTSHIYIALLKIKSALLWSYLFATVHNLHKTLINMACCISDWCVEKRISNYEK